MSRSIRSHLFSYVSDSLCSVSHILNKIRRTIEPGRSVKCNTHASLNAHDASHDAFIFANVCARARFIAFCNHIKLSSRCSAAARLKRQQGAQAIAAAAVATACITPINPNRITYMQATSAEAAKRARSQRKPSRCYMAENGGAVCLCAAPRHSSPPARQIRGVACCVLSACEQNHARDAKLHACTHKNNTTTLNG